MEPTADDALAAGLAASDAGRYAKAYRLLRPLADGGHPEAQARIGFLMALSLHRFESEELRRDRSGSVIDPETAHADLEQGGRFLEAASAAGLGAATFNLAGAVVSGYGGGSWEERKLRAGDLYALAHAQGFTAFRWLMLGKGLGQPYFRLLEEYAAQQKCPLPGEAKRDAKPGGGTDDGGLRLDEMRSTVERGTITRGGSGWVGYRARAN